jgi:hypothetical protein
MRRRRVDFAVHQPCAAKRPPRPVLGMYEHPEWPRGAEADEPPHGDEVEAGRRMERRLEAAEWHARGPKGGIGPGKDGRDEPIERMRLCPPCRIAVQIGAKPPP